MSSDQGYYSLFAACPEDLDFHLQSIVKMLAVAGDVRIYPLCDSSGKISPLLGSLMKALQDRDLCIEITQMGDESPENPNAMLRVWEQACALA